MNPASDLYHEVILDEFQHPRHYGKLEKSDVILEGKNSSCGDAVTIYVQLDHKKHKILNLSWEGQGCAISKAAMSVLSDKLQGLSLEDLQKIRQADVEELLGIEEISIGREKCLLLGLHTVSKLTEKKEAKAA